MSLYRAIGEFVKEGLAPKHCVECQASGAWMCDSCRAKIGWITVQQCYRCGVPDPMGRTCQQCRKFTALASLLVACHFERGPIRSALHQFKYESVLELGDILVGALLEVIPRRLKSSGWVVVPVPGHKQRERLRGYNPPSLLAKRLSRARGFKMVAGLEKVVATTPQVESPKSERKVKVAYSMRARPGFAARRVILVDDVATTGATLEEGARALKAAGAREVIGIVLARSQL